MDFGIDDLEDLSYLSTKTQLFEGEEHNSDTCSWGSCIMV